MKSIAKQLKVTSADKTRLLQQKYRICRGEFRAISGEIKLAASTTTAVQQWILSLKSKCLRILDEFEDEDSCANMIAMMTHDEKAPEESTSSKPN